jgi:hypothetical protein
LLVAFAQRERLGGLDEAAGAVGILLEIHYEKLPSSRPPMTARPGTAW